MATLHLVILYLLLPLSWFVTPQTKEWIVTKHSTLTILGSSNINQFQCVSVAYTGNDILYDIWQEAYRTRTLNGTVVLNASRFDCHNRLMTQDLRKTIQADTYPVIKVRFLEMKRSVSAAQQQPLKGVVDISLVGVSRQYELTALFTSQSKHTAYLTGKLEFSFSDFGLEPPTKMMGAIKVDDCLTIDFNLVLEAVHQEQKASLTNH